MDAYSQAMNEQGLRDKILTKQYGSWAEEIKGFRAEFGLTQQQLANQSGLSCQAIQRYEQCLTMPDSKKADMLLRFIDEFRKEYRSACSEINFTE